MVEQTLVGEAQIWEEEEVDAGLPPTADTDHGHAESLAAYMYTVSQKPLLTTSEERRLAQKSRAGCPRAKEKLVERNMRLVIYNVKRFRGFGLELEELIQEGTLGLIRAVEKFDPSMGYKFSTYATWWINQKAGRAIMDKGRSIRIPVHYQEKLRKLSQAENRLAKEIGREPSSQELGGELSQPVEKVEQMLDARRSVASLDAPIGEDRGSGEGQVSALGDFLADEELAAEVEEGVAKDLDCGRLRHAVGELAEPQRSVLILRYGLSGEKPMTLAEVGAEISSTREMARQYQKRAEKQLATKLCRGKARR